MQCNGILLHMIGRKAALFRPHSRPEHAARMALIAGASQFVCNLALEQRHDWYRPCRTRNFTSQCRKVTDLRPEMEWLKAALVHALQQVLRDVEHACQKCWAAGTQPPIPRREGVNDRLRFADDVSLAVERTRTLSGRLKRLTRGWVRQTGWKAPRGDPRNSTMSHRARQWFAAIRCERDVAELPLSTVCVRFGRKASADMNAIVWIRPRANSASKPMEGNRVSRLDDTGTRQRAT